MILLRASSLRAGSTISGGRPVGNPASSMQGGRALRISLDQQKKMVLFGC